MRSIRVKIENSDVLDNFLTEVDKAGLKKGVMIEYIFKRGLEIVMDEGYRVNFNAKKDFLAEENTEDDYEDDEEPAKEDQIELRNCATCYRPSIVDAGNVCPNCGTVNAKW